jgi:hypothetical protein
VGAEGVYGILDMHIVEYKGSLGHSKEKETGCVVQLLLVLLLL